MRLTLHHGPRTGVHRRGRAALVTLLLLPQGFVQVALDGIQEVRGVQEVFVQLHAAGEHHMNEGQSLGWGSSWQPSLSCPCEEGHGQAICKSKVTCSPLPRATAHSAGTWEGLSVLLQANGQLGTSSPGRSRVMGTGRVEKALSSSLRAVNLSCPRLLAAKLTQEGASKKSPRLLPTCP